MLESKHVNALRGAEMWLRTRAKTYPAKNFNWSHIMESYADSLGEIAAELEKMNLPETVVNLEDLFK